MWLNEAEERNKEGKTKLGTVLVRGDNILFVSPE
jgi:small nuclear ribonucleoprotein (snRNP)-like protein